MSRETHLALRIDWSELDVFGHVNNVMFMKYVQAARLHYVEEIGLMELYRSAHIGFMVAETNCRFKKPLHFPGRVHLLTRKLSAANTSFVLEHHITDEHQQTVAIATDVLVVYDFTRHEKCLIPEAVRKQMES
jgi:acyl-CoA thioester hydrolase